MSEADAPPDTSPDPQTADVERIVRTLGAVAPLSDGLRWLASEAAGRPDGDVPELALVLSELASLTSALLRAADEREHELEAVFAALERLSGDPDGKTLAAAFLAELDPEVIELADGYLHAVSSRLLAGFLGESTGSDDR